MAVRRQLRKLFQERQYGGSITVERRPPLPPPPPPLLLPPPLPLPPPPPAVAVRVWPSPPVSLSPPRRQGLLPAGCAVFQCRGCWAVLGDSLHLCAQEDRRLGILVCCRVTKDVMWEDSLMVGLEGALLGCAYNVLYCRSCRLTVGFILYSASSDLAYLRGLFCFFKHSILCYLLKNQMIIAASRVNFPAVTLKEQQQELKVKLVNFYIRIELVMKKLEELIQNNNVAERQSSVLNAVGLPRGYTIVRVNQ